MRTTLILFFLFIGIALATGPIMKPKPGNKCKYWKKVEMSKKGYFAKKRLLENAMKQMKHFEEKCKKTKKCKAFQHYQKLVKQYKADCAHFGKVWKNWEKKCKKPELPNHACAPGQPCGPATMCAVCGTGLQQAIMGIELAIIDAAGISHPLFIGCC